MLLALADCLRFGVAEAIVREIYEAVGREAVAEVRAHRSLIW
ncbi:hypothetical protein FHR71_003645 [Methylobacterium sp. RAS18]|nr:hypothetical protein [Methylobacterium sp. RAS18]